MKNKHNWPNRIYRLGVEMEMEDESKKNLCEWSHGRKEHATWMVIDPR